MSKQVVTIGYLKSFVSGLGISVSATTAQTDTYCPKYSELTGGTLVKRYATSTYNADNVDGIFIDSYSVGDSRTSYSATQLVVRADLKAARTELSGLTVTKAPTSNIDGGGGSATITVNGKYKITTKNESGSASTIEDEAIPVSALTTTRTNTGYTTLSTKNATSQTLTFSSNGGTSTRSSVVTAKYKQKESISGTVTVTQAVGSAISGYTDYAIRNVRKSNIEYNVTSNTITYDVWAKPVYYSGGTGTLAVYETDLTKRWTGSTNSTCSAKTISQTLTYETASSAVTFTQAAHPDSFVSSSFTITNVAQNGTIPATAETASFKYTGQTVTHNYCTTSSGSNQTGTVTVDIEPNESCNPVTKNTTITVSGGTHSASYTQQGNPDVAISSSFTVTKVTSALTVASSATSADISMSGHWITKHSCVADTTGATVTSSRTMTFTANNGCQRTITSSWTWNGKTVRATVTQEQYDGITGRSLTNCKITSISPTTVPGSGGTVTVKWSGKTHSYHACTGDATGSTTGSTSNSISKNPNNTSRTVTVTANPSWCGQTADELSSAITQSAGVTCADGWYGDSYVDSITTTGGLSRRAFTYNYSSAVPITAQAVVNYKRRYVTYNNDCSIKSTEERDYSSKTVTDISKFAVKRYDMTEDGIYIELSDSHTTWYTINSNKQLVIPANTSNNPREGFLNVRYTEGGVTEDSHISGFTQDGVPCHIDIKVEKDNAVSFYPDAEITVGRVTSALTNNTTITVPDFYEGYTLGVFADNAMTGSGHITWNFESNGFLCGTDYKFKLKRRTSTSDEGDVEVTHLDGTAAPEVEIVYRDLNT